MPADMALGLTALLLVLTYILANFVLARYVATRLSYRFAPRDRAPRIDEDTGIAIDPDDEIVSSEWVETDTLGTRELRSVGRGEMRARLWMFLFALPLLAFLNYRFFGAVAAGFEVTFEFLGGLLVDLFYEG